MKQYKLLVVAMSVLASLIIVTVGLAAASSTNTVLRENNQTPPGPEPKESESETPLIHYTSAITGGPDAFGYTFFDQNDGCSYQMVDISATGSPVVSGDNVSSGPLALSENFNFYGANYNTLVMASNGYISTDPTDTGPDLSNDCPLPVTPSLGGGGRMYPLHDDLITGQGYVEYFANCPRPSEFVPNESCTIFFWDDVTHFEGGGELWEQETIIYHQSGEIVYQIGPGNPELGTGSTTGIQDPSYTIGLQYACNAAASIPDNTAACFVPPLPEIELTKTVGTDPGICAAADAITVTANTEVFYCYDVTNTGDITLTLHDLVDGELGTILSGFSLSLSPGAGVFLTQTATISVTTVNTATWTAYNPGPANQVEASAGATVYVPLPEIAVDPSSLSKTQASNQAINHTLTISNVGFADLEWFILEESVPRALDGSTPQANTPSPISSPAGSTAETAADVVLEAAVASNAPDKVTSVPVPDGTALYDNGPLINSVGTGVGGADESILQNDSLGLSILGFSHRVQSGNRIADDFEVTDAGGWVVDTILFYAYQTNAPITSTITAVNYLIWDGPPGDPGSSVVYGDSSTDRLVDTTWSSIYRVTETTTGSATNRAIMQNTVSAGVYLPQGTYWLDWQSNGSLFYSGPWAPPITINGAITTGNGLQSFDNGITYNPALDDGTATQQGFPFLIMGEVACNTSDIPWAAVSPNSGTTTPGGATPLDVTFDSTGLSEGTYTGNLCVFSNDPDDLVVDVPLNLEVQIPNLHLPVVVRNWP